MAIRTAEALPVEASVQARALCRVFRHRVQI